MTRKLLIILFLAAIASPASAALIPDWGQEYGDEGTIDREDQRITAVDADSSGNVYIAGNFEGQIDLGGPTLFATTANKADFFLAKFTATGQHIWSLAGGGNEIDNVSDIHVIPSGGVVVVGRTNSPTFTVGGTNSTTNGNYDAFVSLFSSNGAHNFTNVYGGNFYDAALSVVWEPSALSVYVGGQFFSSNVNFGTGPLQSSAGSGDMFLLEVKVWGASAAIMATGSTGNDLITGVCLDGSGDLGITGGFSGTINLGNGPLTSVGLGAAFVAKISSVGAAATWSQAFNATASGNLCTANAIASDGAGFYVSGQFNGTANLGAGNHTSNGDYDVWTAAYKSSGTPVWSRTGGSPDYDVANHIDYYDGQVSVAGSFEEVATFDSKQVAHSNRNDALLLVYDVAGDIQYAKNGGGVWDDYGYQTVMNENGIYFVGSFGENASFSGLTLNALAVAPDGFLVNYVENEFVGVDGGVAPLRTELTLGAPTPNPVRANTVIEYRSNANGGVQSAEVFDVTGRRVRTLRPSGASSADAQTGLIQWDGRSDRGRRVPAGVYFVRATDGESTSQRRVNVVR